MKNSLIKPILASLAYVAGLLLITTQAQATPAFARQMSMNCMSCHSQTVPMLNSFGRQFKLTGYSMTDNKPEIKGGDLDMTIPLAINAGVGFKATYLKSGGSRDELAIPGGSAIFVGGKIAEDAGVNTLWNGDGLIHLQSTFTQTVGEGRAGFSIYGGQGHGPFIATESYNTGLHKELAMFDNPGRTNAAQATGIGSGTASGLALFYGGHGLTISGAAWSKGYNTSFANKGLDVNELGSSLYRVSYDMPELASWNISVGAFGLGGSTTGTVGKLLENTTFLLQPAGTTVPTSATLVTLETQANGFDMQASGAIAGMNSQIVVSHVTNVKSRVFNTNTPTTVYSGGPYKAVDAKASSIEAQFMPLAKIGVRAGRMIYSDMLANGDYHTVSLGVVYNYADNIRFSLERSDIDYSNIATADIQETLVQALIGF